MTDNVVQSSLAAGTPRHVQILLFDDVEVLDFAGPFEVFGVTGLRSGPAPFRVETVGLSRGLVRARNGLMVQPNVSIEDAGRCDVLVLPGGYGTRREMHNAALLAWIRRQVDGAEVILSVCTGALLLARAGLLAGIDASLHLVARLLGHAVAAETAAYMEYDWRR